LAYKGKTQNIQSKILFSNGQDPTCRNFKGTGWFEATDISNYIQIFKLYIFKLCGKTFT
jgi:hypothetical protein